MEGAKRHNLHDTQIPSSWRLLLLSHTAPRKRENNLEREGLAEEVRIELFLKYKFAGQQNRIQYLFRHLLSYLEQVISSC